MEFHETFAEKFTELLKEIPSEAGLRDWQFMYRQVALDMGIHILAKFSKDVVGPVNPPSTGNPGAGAGGHPGELCKLVCFILAQIPFEDQRRPPYNT